MTTRKIIFSLICLCFISVRGISLNITLQIQGDNNVIEASAHEYELDFTNPNNDPLNFSASVTGGTIIYQDLNPLSARVFIRVLWSCATTQGVVTFAEINSSQSVFMNVAIAGFYSTSYFCQSISPSNQDVFVNQQPSVITVTNCTVSCVSAYNITYKWQESPLNAVGGATGPFTDIPNETNESYQPPTLNAITGKGYRRITRYTVPGNSPQDVNSDVSIVRYYGHLYPGDINANNLLIYANTVPGIWINLPQGGICNSIYTYTWQISIDNGNSWQTIGGNTYYYPNSVAIEVSNTKIRRKVSCGSEIAYSNILTFIVVAHLDPGGISGAGPYDFNSVPVITQTPATGGTCLSSDYIYTWERSIENNPWDVIGTGVAYPQIPIVGNTRIRRKVSCYGEELYTNAEILVMNPYVSANSENLNYVRENDVVIPGIRTWPEADILLTGSKFQTTVYIDGLGRPIQKVSKQTSLVDPFLDANDIGKYQDLVRIINHDGLGRITRDYLPYASTTDLGFFKTNTLAEQKDFINTISGELSTNIYTYAENEFYSSPLKELKKSNLPGNSWRTSSNYYGNTFDYTIYNEQEQILIWDIGYDSGERPVNTAGSVYKTGKLIKNITKDDRNRLAIEYKDFYGNLVFKKIQEEDGAALIGYQGWNCTYFVYDDFNHLRYTITPKAVATMAEIPDWTITNEIRDGLCFYQEYDERGRVVVKHSPDAGDISLIYDSRDRLILSQDQNQKSITQWAFSIYDEFDNNVANGLMNNGNTRDQMVDFVNNNLTNGKVIDMFAIDINEEINAYNPVVGKDQATGNQFCNSCSDIAINSINYYDGYNTTSKQYVRYDDNYFAPTSNTHIEARDVTGRLRGQPTGTKTRILDDTYHTPDAIDDHFLISTNYYDEKLRPIQISKDNIRKGVDVTSMLYDFSSKLLSTNSIHGADDVTFTDPSKNVFNTLMSIGKYDYDLLGRQIMTRKLYTFDVSSIADINNFRVLNTVKFDQLGRVKIKEIGSDPIDPDKPMEVQNMSYNIQGWLTGINKDYATAMYPGNPSYEQSSCRYGFYFGYAHDDYVNTDQSQYNGNIAKMIWRSQGDNIPRQYLINYDILNRLKDATFNQVNDFGPSNNSPGWSSSLVTLNSSEHSYDKNGNIIRMQQYGIMPGTSGGIKIDDLEYVCKPYSNKLQQITDHALTANSGKLGDFIDANDNSAYEYDANGNQTMDKNKGITYGSASPGIIYNFLDLPEEIHVNNQSNTEYVYDAAGNKLAKKVENIATSNVTTTYFADEFVYQDDDLQYILNEEGKLRIMTPIAAANPPSYQVNYLETTGNISFSNNNKWGVWDFYINDNLGNMRMTLTDEHHLQRLNCGMEYDPNDPQTPGPEEEATFGQADPNKNEVKNTRTPKPIGWTSNSSAQVSMLKTSSGLPQTNIGPNAILKVMSGDRLYGRADYFYYNNSNTNSTNSNLLSTLVGSFIDAMNGSQQVESLIKDNSNPIQANFDNPTSSPIISFLNNNQPPVSSPTPKAYLNYIFFDEQFRYVSENSGAVAVRNWNGSSGIEDQLPFDVTAPKNGYVYIYLSNASSNISVYFDNFIVNHNRGPIVEDYAYYPYGLKIQGISAKAALKPQSKYGYQGIYSMFNEESGYNEFDLRNYDPQIGRWISTDPYDQYASPYLGMNNNPINYVDEDGGSAGLLGAAIGAVGFGAAAYFIGRNNNVKGAALGLFVAQGALFGAGIGYASFESLDNNLNEAVGGSPGANDPIDGVRNYSSNWWANFRAFYPGLLNINTEAGYWFNDIHGVTVAQAPEVGVISWNNIEVSKWIKLAPQDFVTQNYSKRKSSDPVLDRDIKTKPLDPGTYGWVTKNWVLNSIVDKTTADIIPDDDNHKTSVYLIDEDLSRSPVPFGDWSGQYDTRPVIVPPDTKQPKISIIVRSNSSSYTDINTTTGTSAPVNTGTFEGKVRVQTKERNKVPRRRLKIFGCKTPLKVK